MTGIEVAWRVGLGVVSRVPCRERVRDLDRARRGEESPLDLREPLASPFPELVARRLPFFLEAVGDGEEREGGKAGNGLRTSAERNELNNSRVTTAITQSTKRAISPAIAREEPTAENMQATHGQSPGSSPCLTPDMPTCSICINREGRITKK